MEKEGPTSEHSPISFRIWCAPILIVWALSVMIAITLLELQGISLISFADVPEDDNWFMGIVLTGLLILPILASTYTTSFIVGISFHRKKTLAGKFIDILSCFLIFRILDHYVFESYVLISGIMFFGVGPISAPLFGLIIAIGVLWLLHVVFVGQSKGSLVDWMFCHALGAVLIVLLSFLAVAMLIIIPRIVSLFIYIVFLLILPLPHLWRCYKVYQRHAAAEDSLAWKSQTGGAHRGSD